MKTITCDKCSETIPVSDRPTVGDGIKAGFRIEIATIYGDDRAEIDLCNACYRAVLGFIHRDKP